MAYKSRDERRFHSICEQSIKVEIGEEEMPLDVRNACRGNAQTSTRILYHKLTNYICSSWTHVKRNFGLVAHYTVVDVILLWATKWALKESKDEFLGRQPVLPNQILYHIKDLLPKPKSGSPLYLGTDLSPLGGRWS